MKVNIILLHNWVVHWTMYTYGGEEDGKTS